MTLLMMILHLLQFLPVVDSFWNDYLKMELPPSTSSIQFIQHDLISDGTMDLGLLFFKTDDGSDVTNKTVSSFVSFLSSFSSDGGDGA